MFPNRRITTSGGDKFRDDRSFYFDGTDAHVALGDITSFDGLDDLTIACWVKLDSDASGYQPFLCKGLYNNSSAAFHFNISPDASNGRMRFSVGNSLFAYKNNCVTNHGFNLDAWNHVAVTYSNTDDEIYLYINGKKNSVDALSGAGSTATYVSIPANAAPSRIASDDLTNFLKGKISDVAAYNSALTASQIKTIYNGKEPYNHKEGIASNNLISWWRMGDNNPSQYPIVLDSASSLTIGSDLIPNAIFESNTTGWSDNDGGGGGAITRDTSTVYRGSGSGKITWPDPPVDYWGAMTTSDITPAADTIYVASAYLRYGDTPTGAVAYLTDGASFNNATSEYKTHIATTDLGWNYVKTVFRTLTDDAGKIYIRTLTTPSAGNIVYVDDITLKPYTGGNIGVIVNSVASDLTGDTP